MLKRTDKTVKTPALDRIVIVASAFNAKYVDGMLDSALDVLSENGTGEIELVRVPGAFEIPVAVAKIARRKRNRPPVIICLGIILRGETTHAEHIGMTVSRLLGEIAVETGVPIIHEVLLLENESQARRRCLHIRTNRGSEAAHTALKIAHTIRSL